MKTKETKNTELIRLNTQLKKENEMLKIDNHQLRSKENENVDLIDSYNQQIEKLLFEITK